MIDILSAIAFLALLVLLVLRIAKERPRQPEPKVLAPPHERSDSMQQCQTSAAIETTKSAISIHLRGAGSRSETITI